MQPAPYVPETAPVQPTAPIWPVQPVQPVDQPIQSVQADQPARRSYRMDQSGERSRAVSPAYRASQIVYLLLGIAEALMIIRVALKLLAANADVGFVRFIYGLSAPLVAPFQGIFPTPVSNTNVLELSSLVAIVVYALVAWGIARIIFILWRRPLTTTTG